MNEEVKKISHSYDKTKTDNQFKLLFIERELTWYFVIAYRDYSFRVM